MLNMRQASKQKLRALRQDNLPVLHGKRRVQHVHAGKKVKFKSGNKFHRLVQ